MASQILSALWFKKYEEEEGADLEGIFVRRLHLAPADYSGLALVKAGESSPVRDCELRAQEDTEQPQQHSPH